MRYLGAMGIALVLLFGALWVGSRIAFWVSQGSSESAEFLRGQELDLCGYRVDVRHELAGYDLEQWSGDRCEALSELDVCLLECLAGAEAVEIAAGCYDECVKR